MQLPVVFPMVVSKLVDRVIARQAHFKKASLVVKPLMKAAT